MKIRLQKLISSLTFLPLIHQLTILKQLGFLKLLIYEEVVLKIIFDLKTKMSF